MQLSIRIANNIDFGKSWTYNLCALYSRNIPLLYQHWSTPSQLSIFLTYVNNSYVNTVRYWCPTLTYIEQHHRNPLFGMSIEWD